MLHIRKIKPLFTTVITTGNKFEKDMVDQGLIIAKQGDLKLWQQVVAVGSSVRDIQVGDWVMIKPENYARKKYSKDSVQNDLDNNPIISYDFKWVTLEESDDNPMECLVLNDRDIEYVFEGEEKNESLITPGKPQLILS